MDEEERNIVGTLAYLSACWESGSPMPTGGRVGWADPDE
jgi:hypothetical protein